MPIAALHCTVGLAPGLGAVRRPFAQRCRGWGACARPRIQLCKASEGDGLKPGREERTGVGNEASASAPGTLDTAASWAVWAILGGYIGWVYLSTGAPGNPAWNTAPETMQEFINECISIWYINPVLSWFNLSLLPDAPEHPVAEALFTLITTWDIMLWPAIAADKKGQGVKYRKELWYGSLAFLTAFILPYMALRLSTKNEASADEPPKFPPFTKAIGWFGLTIAAASVVWVLSARPEYGDLASRLEFAVTKFNTDRVFYALTIDCLVFSVVQFLLMEGAPLKYRLFPYVGLGLWLVESE